MIHQPLQSEHADNVRLGFFQPAEDGADGFANTHLASWSAGKRGTEAVAISCMIVPSRYPSPETLAAWSARIIVARDRNDHVVHARIHEILEENLLASLLFVDAGIVGQVVGYCLVAVAQIGRRDTARPSPPSASPGPLRRAVFGGQRQRVLNIAQHTFRNISSFLLSSSLRIMTAAPYEAFTPSRSSSRFRRERRSCRTSDSSDRARPGRF